MHKEWRSKKFSRQHTVLGISQESLVRDVLDFLNEKGLKPGEFYLLSSTTDTLGARPVDDEITVIYHD